MTHAQDLNVYTRNVSCDGIAPYPAGVENSLVQETGINLNSLGYMYMYFDSSVDVLPVGLTHCCLCKMRSELNHSHTPMNCSTVRLSASSLLATCHDKEENSPNSSQLFCKLSLHHTLHEHICCHHGKQLQCVRHLE